MPFPKATAHSSFTLLRSQTIDSLNLQVEEYQHNVTGAQHIHIAADNNENVFLVALRTVPEDSRGVAHILEHTALCGSEKYPVRDPFFMMIRRSLNTFMNAFTSSDWTAYPFASQNSKDFDNLLDVYLDAVFFSRLDPLDFAQEGHRLEFSEANNTDSELVYKGVVFNEMKGAMSSATSVLWQTLSKYVFPSSTYHHNSGGDPECIPDLSYEQLQTFYQTHYHPSNATFMTFGDRSAKSLQERFDTQVLQRFEKLNKTISVPDEKRYYAPLRVEEAYACDEESTQSKTHIVTAWLLGHSANLEKNLHAQLLSAVLLENSASPLQKALETTSLGSSPSPLCGLEDSQKELLFVAGIEGSESKHSLAVEKLVLDAITDVANNGVSQSRLEACLHQLELQQREISGDSYPYGLQLILTSLSSAIHRGDAVALLDLDPALEKLRQQIQQPNFIQDIAKELLLDNPHRVTLTLRPDDTLSGKRVTAEVSALANIKAGLSDAEKQRIVQQSHDLQQRQQQVDDDAVLPKVGLEDIPADLPQPSQQSLSQDSDNQLDIQYFTAGTNGLVYQQVILPLPELNDAEKQLLPYYTSCLTELGVGDKDYLATQDWQSEVCGSLYAYTSIRSDLDDVQNVHGYMILSGKGLQRNHQALCELMLHSLEQVKFSEHKRIGELVSQIRARREMSITGNGHSLAMLAAASGACGLAQYSHTTSGLAGIQAIKTLDDNLQQADKLKQFAQQMCGLHQKILQNSQQLLLISDEKNVQTALKTLQTQWQTPVTKATAAEHNTHFSLVANSQTINQFWQANTQVNFCARAYPTVNSDHADAPALTVLGGFLRNGYLHRTIREQGGAYGGGASQDSNCAAFRFYSYRDPRFSETLEDFDQSIQWLLNEEHQWQAVEEAILGVISGIDKPSSPSGESKSTFFNNLHGRDAAQRKRFRDAVLKVTASDLQRVARTYLTSDKASTAVIGNQASRAEAKQHQLEIIQL